MSPLPAHVKGKSTAQCTGCDEVFSSVSTFDRHQSESYRASRGERSQAPFGRGRVTCHDPAKRGLVFNEHSQSWSTSDARVGGHLPTKQARSERS